MNEDILRLRLQDFRAIKKADIKLDGITLVSGVNGCGKSTLSRLLYHIIDDANNYDRLIEERVSIRLQIYTQTVQRLLRTLTDIKEAREAWLTKLSFDLSSIEVEFLNKTSLTLLFGLGNEINEVNEVNEIIAKIIAYYQMLEKSLSHSDQIRINSILRDGLMKEGGTLELLNEISSKIQSILNDVFVASKKRPSKFLWEKLGNVFDRTVSKSSLTLWQYGTILLSPLEERLNTPVAIERAIYIDTPMSMGGGETFLMRPQIYRYWQPLSQLLKNRSDRLLSADETKEHIEKDLRDHVLHGVSSWDNDTRYVFTRADGKLFNLLECATGVKAFSIIQMLLRNGWLTRQTLLIIDEPEAHLHPQWIVEYARLIVLLNKHIGVKFFLASHSPDMVSAIKYISESEGVSDVLNFYLAEEVDQTMQYRYKPLGTDVEPIFASFNIALDRIDQYGASQTEPES